MKKLGMVLILLSASLAFADGKDEKFNEHKQKALQNMDERITGLQNAKACISAASDRASMKKCHEQLAKARQDRKAASIDQRMSRLQEMKSKMGK